MDSLSEQIGIILVACIFFLVVSVGIVLLFLLYQKRQLQFIHEKKELSNRFQSELLKTKMEAQEETLAHVGRELHDNIGQLLSSSKMLLAASENSPQQAQTLAVVDKTLSEAIVQVRALSKSLSTDWLEKFDLITHLQAEVNRLSLRNFLNVELQHPDELLLSREQQIILFRMTQECIQNAIKHAEATMVRIHISEGNNQLSLTVDDNGRGFSVAQTTPGVGMLNTKTRAQLLGGSAQWTSNPNGTTVKIEIPYA